MLNAECFVTDIKKPNLVLIHGLFGDKDNLTLLRRSLADAFNVMMVDLPNHGKSPAMQNWTFEKVAQQLDDTCKHRNFVPDALIGHSLGGKVAMAYSLVYPEKLKANVVADIAPVKYGPRHDTVFAALNEIEQVKPQSRAEAATILARILEDKSTQQFLLKSFKKINDIWQWQFNLSGINKDYQTMGDWPFDKHSTATPTLFVKGGRSDYLNASHTNAVNYHFPNTEVKIISDAGHWLHAEKPTSFNRIVSQFLHRTLM